MFSRLSSMLHHAVEAFAPNMPVQQEFTAHWKAVTHYFVDNKDHKICVDQTKLPVHLDKMIQLLVSEENSSESGISGPAMEYLLHHKILETLYTLARTDCPPGMKQVVLQFFTKLLSRIRQPLLPHIHVHRPVQRMVRLCGEIKAGPTEVDEIQFLLTVCAQLKSDSYLVSFFIENGKLSGNSSLPVESGSFFLISSLLTLMQSPDARVAVKACEGLMLCASLPEMTAAQGITMTTTFCQRISNQLCTLYEKIPSVLDPADIESVEAKWGLDVLSDPEDHLTFAGKRQIISFLSWLDYCDQLVHIAHPDVATALAKHIREHYLEKNLLPKLVQASEGGAITATAHLTHCIRHVTSWTLLAEFVYFTLGDERSPEVSGSSVGHSLRRQLLDRCNHLSEEVCITTMKLFELLIHKECDLVSHNLVLRNLLGRTYIHQTDYSPSPEVPNKGSPQNEEVSTAVIATADGHAEATSSETPVDSTPAEGDELEIEATDSPRQSPPANHVAAPAVDELASPEHHQLSPQSSVENEFTPPSSPSSDSGSPSVHQVVSSFLHILPEDAKSSYETGDTGYDTYLRDAHRQFADMSVQCLSFQWPLEPVRDEAYVSNSFYEGAFLKVLFDKLSSMLDQSYDINLQVTSLISRLALLPHPNLHEYLLNPNLPLTDGARNLPSVLSKLAADVRSRMRDSEDFMRRLLNVRRDLMGFSGNLRRSPSTQQTSVDDGNMLAAIIVLEEFCKELAAISFVKSYGV